MGCQDDLAGAAGGVDAELGADEVGGGLSHGPQGGGLAAGDGDEPLHPVSGREVLACVTRIAELGDPVVVEPLAGAAVAGDLVVDMEHVYRRLEPVGRPLVRASERAGKNDAKAGAGPLLEDLERFEDCIECGLCLSACPVAGDPRFLGPAALAAAERVLEEPRGTDGRAVLGLVDDAHGAWRCHLAFECSAVCPAGVDPGGAIMRLRRRVLADRLPRLVGRYHQEVPS